MRSSLNFDWRFCDGFEDTYLQSTPKQAEKVDIPHTVKMVPERYFNEKCYQGVYTYVKEFDVTDGCPIHSLLFEGAMLQFDAWLNGSPLGHFVSGYLPVEIDVSKLLLPKKNRLLIKLDTREDPNIPPFGYVVDYLTFGGIYRPVWLVGHPNPESYVKDAYLEAHADGRIKVIPEIVGGGTPTFELYDAYHLVKAWKEEETRIENITPWSLENPKLYRLKVILGADVYEKDIGFRDVLWTEHGFFLNGKKVKLVGLNRHQTFPYFGAAATPSLQREDAHILKETAGVNLVRTSHYADSEDFLDECDRIGLLVVDEIPGWQYTSKVNKVWRDNLFDFTERLVRKERNHPALIAYGLRVDESLDDKELNEGANRIQKKLDPSRQSLGVRFLPHSELYDDIYAYNDFSCNSTKKGLLPLKDWGVKGKPRLVSEFMGHMYPTKPEDTMSRKREHTLRHARVLNDGFAREDLAGMCGWCAFDYNTHHQFGSNDAVCHHGVMDIFRMPKLAMYVYASQQEGNRGMGVASQLQGGDEDAGILGPIWVFVNADRVDLLLNGEKINSFLPDKADFPNLPHPPFKIDDFIGDRVDEEGLSPKEKALVKRALNSSRLYGSISRSDQRKIAFLCWRHHLTSDDLYRINSQYTPADDSVWSIRAYRKDELIAEKNFSYPKECHYRLSCAHEHLTNGDTYDMARVAIEKVDQFGNRMEYAHDALAIEAEGPIEVVGPKRISLEGGVSAVFVRSLPTKQETVATLKVCGEENTEIKLVVE